MKTEFNRDRAVLTVYASSKEIIAMRRAQGVDGDKEGMLLIHELQNEKWRLAADNKVPVEIEIHVI